MTSDDPAAGVAAGAAFGAAACVSIANAGPANTLASKPAVSSFKAFGVTVDILFLPDRALIEASLFIAITRRKGFHCFASTIWAPEFLEVNNKKFPAIRAMHFLQL
ncbi:hypothetical protein [Microvirga sp. M2]|uniref:hypothetical protein n=1 Tax=Microvirga sp. M2 TaxID=3073270 RepID=UPI0039C19C38